MAKLKINRGTTYKLGYTHSHDNERVSLEGAIVRFTVKSSEFDASQDDSTAVIKKDITTGTADGYAEIVILPEDTATLDPEKEYYYDIRVDENSDGTEVYKMDEGTIELDGSPTNRLN